MPPLALVLDMDPNHQPTSNLVDRLRQLQSALEKTSPHAAHSKEAGGFITGLTHWDALLPNQLWPRAAIHEFLADEVLPLTLTTCLAARARHTGAIAWIDPQDQGEQGGQGGQGGVYPPAVAALGIPLSHVLWVRPGNDRDLVWAAAECLRCPGVDVTIVAPPALSQIQARRLQLAAETGGGVGLFLRHSAVARASSPCPESGHSRDSGPFFHGQDARATGPFFHRQDACATIFHRQDACATGCYAAATRWLVTPIASPGSWKWTASVKLIHGHGGLVGQEIRLELDHETHTLRVLDPVADRSAHPSALRAYA